MACYCCNLCGKCGKLDKMRQTAGKRLCPACRLEVPGEARNCPDCGQPLPPPFPPPPGVKAKD